MSKQRTIIVGLDGVPYQLIKDWARQGIMPNTQTLINRGTLRQMRSSIPEVSAVAWSSIITGANPAEHGIFGFTDRPTNSDKLTFPNFDDLKAPPFWLQDNNRKYIIINVPATYPARALNGLLVSGFVAVDLAKAVYPLHLIEELKEINYKIDVDTESAHQSLDVFIEDFGQTLTSHLKAFRYFWQKDWQTFMFVFTEFDRLAHFLWPALEDAQHQHHSIFINYFQEIDKLIGEVLNNISPGDLLIILSDHGFERLDQDVYINSLLNPSQAFALDPARIYIKGNDKKTIINELETMFNALEFAGKKVVKRIYHKREIYHGPYLNRAPDLVLSANRGFNLRAGAHRQATFNKGIINGKHTLEDAFLLINRNVPDSPIPTAPTVYDIVKIIKAG
ncbi:MAG: alkaline phosphatase family protein [bacterium]